MYEDAMPAGIETRYSDHALSNRRTRIFFSYARLDRAPVEAIRALLIETYDVFIDVEDLIPGEDWERRLEKLVLEADIYAFIVSPRSIASRNCRWELDRASVYGKKLLPIIWRPVPAEQMPPELAKVNYVRFDKLRLKDLKAREGVDASLRQIHDALSLQEIYWAREMTEWIRRAGAWSSAGEGDAPGFLLRSQECAALQRAVSQRPPSAPAVADIVFKYLHASLAHDEAERAILLARERRISAHSQRLVAHQALNSIAEYRPDRAMRLCLAALPDRASRRRGIQFQPELEAALASAAHRSRLMARYPSPLPSDHEATDRHFGLRALYRIGDGPWSTYLPGSWFVGSENVSFCSYIDNVNTVRVECDPMGNAVFDAMIDGIRYTHHVVTGQCRGMLLSPDGRYLLVFLASWGEVATWDVKAGVEQDRQAGRPRLALHTPLVASLWQAAAAASDNSGEILVWTLADPNQCVSLRGHARAPLSLEFHPDGAAVLSASHDGTVRLWNSATGEELCSAIRYDASVGALFSPDGSKFAIRHDRGVSVLRFADRELVAELYAEKSFNRLQFSKDGNRLFAEGKDAGALEWNLAISSPIETIPSLPGRGVIAISANGRIARLVRNSEGCEIEILPNIQLAGPSLPDLYAPATANWTENDTKIRWWARHPKVGEPELGFVTRVEDVHTDEIAAENKDERLLCTEHLVKIDPTNRRVRLRALRSGQEAVASFEEGESVVAADIGRYIVFAAENLVRVDRLAQGDTMSIRFANVGVPFVSLAGRWLAAGARLGPIPVWDLERGVQVALIGQHDDVLASSLFSASGGTSIQGTIKLRSVSLSANESLAITTGGDGTVRVWTLEEDKPPVILRGHDKAVLGAECSSKGRRIVSWGDDGTVRVWSLDSRSELARIDAGARLIRGVKWIEENLLAVWFEDLSAEILDTSWLTAARGYDLAELVLRYRLVGSSKLEPEERVLIESLIGMDPPDLDSLEFDREENAEINQFVPRWLARIRQPETEVGG